MHKFARYPEVRDGALPTVFVLFGNAVDTIQIAALLVLKEALEREGIGLTVVADGLTRKRRREPELLFRSIFRAENIQGTPKLGSFAGLDIAYSEVQFPDGFDPNAVLSETDRNELDALQLLEEARLEEELFRSTGGLDTVRKLVNEIFEDLKTQMRHKPSGPDSDIKLSAKLQGSSLADTLNSIWSVQTRFRKPAKKKIAG